MKMTVLCVLIISIATTITFGQAAPVTEKKSSEVTVTVKDEEGAVIAKAFVLLRADHLERDNPKPFRAEMRTDAAGQARKSIPQGFYDLFIASNGFAPYCLKLRVRDGEPVVVNIALKIDKLMADEYGTRYQW
jgi:hypothetical protein